MKRNRESFISQWPYKADVNNIKDILIKDDLYSTWYPGIEVYRALNLLLIKIDGQFYGHK